MDSPAGTRLQIGADGRGGVGAGEQPAIGQKAAVEDRDRIAEVLKGADMVFVTAGMGGGTGTGAAPIVAETARASGALSEHYFSRAAKVAALLDESPYSAVSPAWPGIHTGSSKKPAFTRNKTRQEIAV